MLTLFPQKAPPKFEMLLWKRVLCDLIGMYLMALAYRTNWF